MLPSAYRLQSRDAVIIFRGSLADGRGHHSLFDAGTVNYPLAHVRIVATVQFRTKAGNFQSTNRERFGSRVSGKRAYNKPFGFSATGKARHLILDLLAITDQCPLRTPFPVRSD